ncbi:hypothetical protein FGIG_01922 [Fasciola gigantica]|uniref:Uncharacterized protein n=1 Tax=Fasciola gigantica TaxID=46835 RepID=A0A504YLK7_FASGI|nr:hypothetical protein FGIG_01922 [Fasciola gigantica]
MGPVSRTGCHRNPRTAHHAAYAVGHGNSTSYGGQEVVSHPDPGLLFNPLTNEMLCAPDTTHTYYEITGGHQAQTISQQRHAMALQPRDVNLSSGDILDDWTRSKAASETEHKSFTSAATLGRPATGKGKRRATTKGDSMYNSKAGELALHSNKKSTTVSEKIHDCSGTEDHPIHKSNLATEDSAYSTKSPGQYTYQAYREGTFV